MSRQKERKKRMFGISVYPSEFEAWVEILGWRPTNKAEMADFIEAARDHGVNSAAEVDAAPQQVVARAVGPGRKRQGRARKDGRDVATVTGERNDLLVVHDHGTGQHRAIATAGSGFHADDVPATIPPAAEAVFSDTDAESGASVGEVLKSGKARRRAAKSRVRPRLSRRARRKSPAA